MENPQPPAGMTQSVAICAAQERVLALLPEDILLTKNFLWALACLLSILPSRNRPTLW